MSTAAPQSPNAKREKTWNVGIIINDFTDPVYAKIAERISQKLLEGDPHNCIVCSTKEDKGRERVLAAITSGHVDGLFVVTAEDTSEYYQRLRLPVVLIDRDLPKLNASLVSLAHTERALTLTEHMIGKGCKKLACLSPALTYVTATADKLSGFRAAVSAAGAEEIRTGPIGFDHVDEDVHARLETFIQTKNIPDAVLAINCKIAMSLLTALQKPQFAALEKMKIACFEDCDQFNAVAVKVTSMSYPVEELSSAAVELMLNAIGPQPVSRKIFLQTTLIERG